MHPTPFVSPVYLPGMLRLGGALVRVGEEVEGLFGRATYYEYPRDRSSGEAVEVEWADGELESQIGSPTIF